jgi:cell division protein FtsW
MSVESKGLFVVTGTLLAFGLAVLFSASALEATRKGLSSTHYLSQQLLGVVAGGVLFAAAAKIDAEKWREWAWYVVLAAALPMLIIILPFTPPSIAPEILGSRRYLSLGGVTVQPSEGAKLAVIVWTAMLVVKKGGMMRHLLKGVTPFLVVVGALALLAAIEPDLSLALTLFLIMGVILFARGARIGHFLFLGALGTPVLWGWVNTQPYVMKRFDFLLNPAGIDHVAPQLKQSLIAVGSGRLFGQGFGEGMQQAGWVSMGFNDFVGSVIGEEWGFLGMLFVICLFSLFGWLGFRIANSARTRFQQLVAIGLTFTIVFTAFVHLGVVIGMLPTTGLTLPFISHGRSNLLLSLVMTGILVNIGSTREKILSDEKEEERLPVAGIT